MDIKRELFEKAKQAGENAYAPYSGYKVGRRFARPREKFMRHAMLKTFLFPAAPVLRQGQ